MPLNQKPIWVEVGVYFEDHQSQVPGNLEANSFKLQQVMHI